MIMNCIALKMKRQLLVLLVVDVTAGAYLPMKETSLLQASGSELFPETNDELHLVTSANSFYPVVQTVSGESVLNSHLPESDTVNSSQRKLASEMKQDYVSSDGVSILQKETHRIKTRSSNSDAVSRTGSDFVFPVKPSTFVPKQDVKNCSDDGTDLCVSNVRDYPYQHIERLLQNRTLRFQSYFTDDVVRVATRFDSSSDEELTCDAEETILYPKFGKTANNEMLFIINNEDKYRQGIRVEKCKKTGVSPCNPKLEVPNGYKSYCKQKYIYRKLLALHPNGEPAPDNFRIPSCCSCFISKDID